MKILDGSELAGYIKERQLKQVRGLRQSWKVFPRLAIIRSGENSVIDVYVKLKQIYGEDINIEVDVYNLQSDEIIPKIEQLNIDDSVHGIIVQLPLQDESITESVLKTVSPEKDVDGLGENPKFTPATAMAIDWLTVGYNIDLQYKKIAIVGNGRLVGAPLYKLWKKNWYDVTVYDSKTENLTDSLKEIDVIISATGVPGLITSEMVKQGAVVIDAGTASENGRIIGDVANDVRERNDITITPIKGGVGPLTISALFDNVIASARKIADAKGQQDL